MTAPFQLLGELPTGTTVLEASAGTGKTFTIAGLVARYVAEGAATMDQLLVVTFGRAATRELRERVRERLVSARDGLADPDTARASSDAVLAHLAAVPDAEVDLRRRRLEAALASYDSATVATTHQFCQQVLTGLGTSADHDGSALLVESLDDLVVEAADDLYLRKWAAAGDPELTRKQALDLARCATGDPSSRLVPSDADPASLAALRLRYAESVRAEVERRKQDQRLMGFDDLLTRLAETLRSSGSDGVAARRLRQRYSVVLVDEFQDTDPVQWDILRLAFHGHATLVLIGDPKQAIYAFRGADVHAYLDARSVAGTEATLATNWRSDRGVLQGLDAIFRGAQLGEADIVVRPVGAAHDGPTVLRPSPVAPVRLRVLPRDGLNLVGSGSIQTDAAREAVRRDVAAQVLELLTSGVRLRPRDGGPERAVEAGDIAVIVRRNADATAVHEQLLDVGVPSVVTGTRSVFDTPAAVEWAALLEALEQPHRSVRVRRLALGCFVGWTATRLASATDAEVDALAVQVREWAVVLQERGVAALLATVTAAHGMLPRLLQLVDGERLVTDLRHIGEVLHDAALEGQLGLTALLGWLRRRIDEAGSSEEQERTRRLDTDAAAVQVVTVHASKGLEFPVVLVPFGWSVGSFTPDIPAFHDGHQRCKDISGGPSADFAAHVKAHKAEEAGEELRLLYVALTRAQAELVVWWAPAKVTERAPLHRLLFASDPAAEVPASLKLKEDAPALAVLESRASSSGGGLAVEVVAPVSLTRWSPLVAPAGALSAAVFDRSLDLGWRRTSYTALTSRAHEEPGVASEPEEQSKDDEADLVVEPVASDHSLREVPSPLLFPGGAAFGTLVHGMLEVVDPTRADLAAALAEVATRTAPEGLAEALVPSLQTPLGPLAGGRSLSEIPVSDRLAELDFELPLVGGDAPTGSLSVRDLAPLLARHLASGPLAAYPSALERLDDVPLRGYLAGSIDAVLRVDGRYLVVDYKTNRLAAYDEELTLWHYRQPALAEAMIAAHYPLQALLYCVALHRYLRWRLASYDPAVHLGGVLYLFLRGMSPGVLAADGSVPGVFSWQPPAALVVELSDLLARGRA